MARKTIRDITHYGEYENVGDILYNEATRSITDYDQMRKHPMVHLGLQILKLNLQNVTPVWSGDDEEKVKVIKTITERIWKQLIVDATEMLDYGWKVFELRYDYGKVQYEFEDKNKTYEGLILKKPKSLHGGTIDILIDENGSFRGFVQDGNENRKCLAVENKALLFTNNMRSGNYYGQSDLEFIYTYWYDTTLERQFYMRWLERMGMGNYIGRYKDGKSTSSSGGEVENSTIMLGLLDDIMEGTSLALPSGTDENGKYLWDIMTLNSEQKTDMFIQKQQYNNQMILRGLVIPEQSVIKDNAGAYSSTEIYFNTLVERKQMVLNQIVDTINKYMIKPFAKMVYGEDFDIDVVAGKLDDRTKDIALEITKKLIDSGRKVVRVEWLEEHTGIPFDEDEEQELIEQKQNENILEENKEDIKNEVDNYNKNIDNDVDEEKEKMSEIDGGDVLNKFNFSDLDKTLDMYEAKFIDELVSELLRQQDRILKHIDKNYSDMLKKPIDSAKSVTISKSKLNPIYKENMAGAYDYSFAEFQRSIEGKTNFAENEKSFINFRASNSSNKLSTDIENSIQYTIMDYLKRQLSVNELKTKIKEIFQSFMTRINTICRSEVGFTLTRANDDYVLLNKRKVVKGELKPEKEIKRFKSSAIIDNATTDLCFKLNGVVVDYDSPILSEYKTPRHYNCRSIWVPVSQKQIDNLKIKGTDISTDKNGKPYNSKTIISDRLKGAANQQQF